jgi:hypothetical protein
MSGLGPWWRRFLVQKHQNLSAVRRAACPVFGDKAVFGIKIVALEQEATRLRLYYPDPTRWLFELLALSQLIRISLDELRSAIKS